ncbi:WD40/YVTN/BNR-like repeat-containing protein [Sulfobacillus harzensis]|uniref:Exo-alpha-sialidase n=1 Tax=Sulfobacillus harzensis TaxID=2729629 RepID=A0A7Y0Q3U8_9FIRM|nr:sialidase family protein [Sulfobacillus harzensis]NMP23356.1 exo-alpha-sialidase [Sulfobacillus harzensis]
MHLLIGTAKGLFRFHSVDRHRWEALGPVQIGTPIYTSAYNPEGGTLYAAVNSEFYGPSIRRSHDWGETWDTGGTGLQYAPDDPEKVTRVWAIHPEGGHLVYAGVEASGLFRSIDGGDTWSEVKALRDHPTHESWGPGYGGKCLHTIAVDSFNAERLYVACSSGGIYRSDDAGEHWLPINQGIRADFMPEDQRYPISGQCVHKFVLSPVAEGRIWLQNHGGVYRSDDGGTSWESVGDSLPSDFGFPIVTHPQDADRAYVVPLEGWPRWSPDNVLAVYETQDAGGHWTRRHEGLPAPTFSGVLRDAFTRDNASPLGLYFGTTSGAVFHSADAGESWHLVAEHLPRIYSVVVAED